MPDQLDRLKAALADRYAVDREVGAGGMATVYLAQDLKHGRKVAVKVLRPQIAATLGADRFSREIQVAAQLQHPHILPLLDSGEAGGFFYYVMPFVDGESLRDRLAKHGELPIQDAVRILIEIADALAHAHAHGVVHRDIKPDNIMLSGRHALVTDFGVAKAVSEATGRQTLTTAGVALGTPAYMAPEQAAADPHLDHRVDIYALGALAYELLTGQPPFTGRSPQEVLAAHVTQQPEPVEKRRAGLSPTLSHVLMKALAKRPADRWQTAEEMLAQLEPLATPSGGMTPTMTRPIAAGTPSRSRWLLAGAGAGVLIVLSLAALLVRGGAPDTLLLGRRVQATRDPGLEIDAALSPDGQFVAYAATAGLFVRQTDGGVPVQVAAFPNGGARLPVWTPDGRQILFGSPRGIELAPALGGASRVVIAAGRGQLAGATIAPDGRSLAYVLNDSILVRPLAGGDARLVTVGQQVHSLTWSPDGKWIAYVSGNVQYLISVGNIAPSGIWVVPAAGGEPVAVTDDRILNQSPAFGPAGTLLYVSSRDGGRDIYQVSLSRSGAPAGPAVRLTTGLDALDIGVSADGRRLAYTAFTETSNIWTMPIPAAGPASIAKAEPLTTGNQTIETFDVSPDGRWLVFDSDRNGPHQIYRLRIGSGEVEQLTSDSAGQFWPSWSPDGKEIAFHGFPGGRRQTFLMPAEGGAPVQITNDSIGLQNPEWAPDGRRLLVLSGPANRRFQVTTRTADRKWAQPEVLPVGAELNMQHSFWSPDGRKIAGASTVNGRSSLTVMSVDGSNVQHIVTASPTGTVSFPQWSEDGRLIYYLAADTVGGSVNVVPVTGGPPRVVVRFDDPARPWHRFGFRVRGGKFYFTLGDLQSDIWVAEVEGK